MENCKVRTDLAVEAREFITGIEGDLRGVSVEEYQQENTDIFVTKVVIESKNGAKAMGKPIGTYITLEAPAMTEADDDYHREVSKELAGHLQALMENKSKEASILVVGLGNRNVTADALGPSVVDNLCITRHIVKEYGAAAYNKETMPMISSIVPGVMANTGMESAEIIRGVVEQTKPDVVIVVDALAARSTKRLNRTIQITNTGIHPGSGVGNHRNELSKESLGIEVIAIGIPTVVDAATIVNDAMDHLFSKDKVRITHYLDQQQPKVMNELNNMYVTSKDIDEMIKRLSFTLSEAIHITFFV